MDYSISIGSTSICSLNCNGIADTGTTLILSPSSQIHGASSDSNTGLMRYKYWKETKNK